MDCRVKAFIRKLENLSISDYHGLSSPGLTCYLNSVLQVLFMTEDFREAVKSKYSTNIDLHLRELFVGLERTESETNHITKKLGITDVYEQRDAAEYFEKILCETSPEASKIFKGDLNHKTTCLVCEKSSESKSGFWILPLAVDDSRRKTVNVKQGLEGFFRVQNVCGDNQIYCESCKEKQDAAIECKMTQCPDVLTLLLKRFTFDYKQSRYVKLYNRVAVARHLHIANCRYNLYAVVHHWGDLTGGHYTADIKSFETGDWYSFNDSVVKRVGQLFEPGDDCLRSCTAYLLMYRKVNE
ncbi:ubiquitin carboxyl-terminal hydrolase 47-like isoform X2 [Cololabis saira]|uniref:ubiquitin carboxyl-terminal hydrolase 47-like isoform X2 n=1 Tax=Cololabis saira TaxID=129043 RepID=UPI002AD447BD|nr:ubiquitin carboxyl-terminal hydrolase 47-like isoform X2 [Cololabis saira]